MNTEENKRQLAGKHNRHAQRQATAVYIELHHVDGQSSPLVQRTISKRRHSCRKERWRGAPFLLYMIKLSIAKLILVIILVVDGSGMGKRRRNQSGR